MTEKLKEALNNPILIVRILDWSHDILVPEKRELLFKDIEVIKNEATFSIIFKDYVEWKEKNKNAHYEIFSTKIIYEKDYIAPMSKNLKINTNPIDLFNPFGRAKHGEISWGYNDKKEWVKFIFDENEGMFVELSKWEGEWND